MFWQRVYRNDTPDVKFGSGIKNFNFGFYPYTDVWQNSVTMNTMVDIVLELTLI